MAFRVPMATSLWSGTVALLLPQAHSTRMWEPFWRSTRPPSFLIREMISLPVMSPVIPHPNLCNTCCTNGSILIAQQGVSPGMTHRPSGSHDHHGDSGV